MLRLLVLVFVGVCSPILGQQPFPEVLPETERLTLEAPLDVVMVDGINRFAEREIERAAAERARFWKRRYGEGYAESVAPNRARLRESIGAVDAIVPEPRLALQLPHPGSELAGQILPVQWPTFEGVNGEGLLIVPSGEIRGAVIAVPDAGLSLEVFVSDLVEGSAEQDLVDRKFLRTLLARGCVVLVPAILNRDTEHSQSPYVGRTNLTHREYIYRMAFEMGRHVIGYEVQKLSAARQALERWVADGRKGSVPVAIAGVGEGGLLALYASAVDQDFDAALVSGYFQPRESAWQEPIYRNVWRLLSEFGDENIASLVAPRALVIEASRCQTVDGPPKAEPGQRAIAAPGTIAIRKLDDVQKGVNAVRDVFARLDAEDRLQFVISGEGTGPAGSPAAVSALLEGLGLDQESDGAAEGGAAYELTPGSPDRQRRQVDELVRWTQMLMHRSDKERATWWTGADRSSLESWTETAADYRQRVYERLIGRIPDERLPLNPRTVKVIDNPDFVGYRVTLDVFPDVIAGGILLLPRDLKQGEQRPVVVCQHGLEGIPEDTITENPDDRAFGPYRGFSAQLARRGFIVYAPQNPYRGGDRFRVIQRKSNLLGRSLFSYIIPQHEQTLAWLKSLPHVDGARIGFYGLSYGGKTAVRVPPFVDDYRLSICSADFNEWVRKNASSDDRYSYVYTIEYEIFEWNMGHVANYAELANLMAPRPFMVERGHHDGVAPDEWVAWEYAKVRRHYVGLGIGDRTEIEWFDGPHAINGKGTFDFLHRHLDWPKR